MSSTQWSLTLDVGGNHLRRNKAYYCFIATRCGQNKVILSLAYFKYKKKNYTSLLPVPNSIISSAY